MKPHPFRNPQAGRQELRGRMMTAILLSSNGQRVLRECKATLDLAVNSDAFSRKLVLTQYAGELDITLSELEDLLKRQ
jgi:hypothetical protein